MADPSAFLLLDPADNILVCTRSVAAGEAITIDGVSVTLSQPIELGHKIARHTLAAGERVLRYGVSIGTIARDAAMGEHVHSHNLKSDYIPAHDRNATGGQGQVA